ncbi:MAG: hypothetical protein SFU86_21270 [Pirellulaceae bacterium]|nr:hypothetical protein [Pirellulaceae bacterium]
MHRNLTIVVHAGVLAGFLLPSGCAPQPAPAPPAPPMPTAAVAAPAPVSPPPVEVVPPAPAPPAKPAEPPVSSERILLLVGNRPLLVEFQLTIAGEPHTQALDKLVAEVLPLADTDGDGRPSWKEITTSKRFKYGQFGNLPVGSEGDVKQVIERYDIDRDGLVDASELPRFLTRNAGGSRAFSVRGTADFRLGASLSPLWKALDENADGALGAAEIAAAAERLRRHDLDDDEILLAAELAPPPNLEPGMLPERRRRGPEIVRLLGPHANWDSVRLLLEEHLGSPLTAETLAAAPGLFARLDANQDGRLQKGEIAGLNGAPADLVVGVDFAPPAKNPDAQTPPDELPPPAAAAIHLVSAPPEVNPQTIDQRPGRLALQLAGVTLTFYVNDTLAGGDFAAQADTQLQALDADKNGYLEESEVPAEGATQLGQFVAVDADENGKVYPAEIAAFLARQQAALRAQIHAQAGDREDPLFAALDQNHDERLDTREMAAAPGRLAALDRAADGQLIADELPSSLQIGLARGSLENMAALFTPPPLSATNPAADSPRWFTAMDANGDGYISPREFIGPADKFASLDKNSDGLVSADEAK